MSGNLKNPNWNVIALFVLQRQFLIKIFICNFKKLCNLLGKKQFWKKKLHVILLPTTEFIWLGTRQF